MLTSMDFIIDAVSTLGEAMSKLSRLIAETDESNSRVNLMRAHNAALVELLEGYVLLGRLQVLSELGIRIVDPVVERTYTGLMTRLGARI